MRGCVGQLAIELRRPDVDAVEQGAAFEVQRQRDDGDRPALRQLRRQVRRRVRHDGDAGTIHGGGSAGLGSDRLRLCLAGKNLFSNQRSATSVMRTNMVETTAVS